MFVGNQDQRPHSLLVLGVFWPPKGTPLAVASIAVGGSPGVRSHHPTTSRSTVDPWREDLSGTTCCSTVARRRSRP